MTATVTINTPISEPSPVYCNFWWNRDGPTRSFTLGTNTYIYPNATYTNETIKFDAIDHESLGHPKVVPPAGVQIIEYLWNFGDGYLANGPQVTHVYKVADPNTTVKLLVTDSRGMRWSCRKPLNLAYSDATGHIVPNLVMG